VSHTCPPLCPICSFISPLASRSLSHIPAGPNVFLSLPMASLCLPFLPPSCPICLFPFPSCPGCLFASSCPICLFSLASHLLLCVCTFLVVCVCVCVCVYVCHLSSDLSVRLCLHNKPVMLSAVHDMFVIAYVLNIMYVLYMNHMGVIYEHYRCYI
jgi:hypothetical protein